VTPPNRTLSRDYKHVRRNTPGGQTFSGWTGLVIGLSIGLAVALGVFLHYRNAAPQQPTAAAAAPPASAQVSEPMAAAAAEPSEYDFYKVLPQQEVEVAKGASSAPPAPAPAPPAAPGELQRDVTLQAGSFKGQEQAEKRQARLAQHGIDSRIQRVTHQDETWYRVRIGPISTGEELENVRTRLAEAEVETTPVSSEIVDAPPP
jgi:cell division protein FtsN